MRLDALAVTILLPDRLPSLIVLIGFWLPPALAGWAVASSLQRRPGSAVACAVAFYGRARSLGRAAAA